MEYYRVVYCHVCFLEETSIAKAAHGLKYESFEEYGFLNVHTRQATTLA